MYKTLILLVLIFLINSCSKHSFGEQEAYNNIIIYQYHDYSGVREFSFLSKYKNLKALDLSGSKVKDLSFIRNLPKLELLILEDTNIEKSEIEKNIYSNNLKIAGCYDDIYIFKNIENCHELLSKYNDLSFYLDDNIVKFVEINEVDDMIDILSSGVDGGFNPSKVKRFNFFKRLRTGNVIKFSNISGILRFINLEKLKIVLYNDKYIDVLLKLRNLKELHLAGDIYNLPIFQKLLTKLYLYNTQITDFSFLKKSNIKELYIITKNFKDRKWNILRKKYSKIKIHIKSLLFMPLYSDGYCFFSDKSKSYLAFEDLYIVGNCKVIENLRENVLDIQITNATVKFMIVNLGINKNHIWLDNDSGKEVTFLDKAIENKNKGLVRDLFNLKRFSNNNPKRACEILKTKCYKISKEIQLILDRKAIIYLDKNGKSKD